MKKYIYKLIYDNYKIETGKPYFENCFLIFLEMEK